MAPSKRRSKSVDYTKTNSRTEEEEDQKEKEEEEEEMEATAAIEAAAKQLFTRRTISMREPKNEASNGSAISIDESVARKNAQSMTNSSSSSSSTTSGSSSNNSAKEVEDRVLATAQHILRSLGNSEAMADDLIQILSTFDRRFSGLGNGGGSLSASTVPEGENEEEEEEEEEDGDNSGNGSNNPAEEKENNRGASSILDAAEKLIGKWHFDPSAGVPVQSFLWEDDRTSDEAQAYLKMIDDVHNLVESLSSSLLSSSSTTEPDTVNKNNTGITSRNLDRGHNLLQAAMCRLEEEFVHLLEKYSKWVDPLSSGPSKVVGSDDGCVSSPRGRVQQEEEEIILKKSQSFVKKLGPIEILPRGVEATLTVLASQMICCGYTTECTHIYVGVRRGVLEESLSRLGVEKSSMEEVQRTGWEVLEREITRWVQNATLVARVLFPSEKRLCDQVMGMAASPEAVFAEIGRGPALQLLHFSDAIAISRRSPDKLFKTLEMYQTLREILPDFQSAFAGAAGASIRSEAAGILLRLSEAGHGMFAEFENTVQREASRNVVVPGGMVHQLTRYVMEYMQMLCNHQSHVTALDEILREKNPGTSLTSPLAAQITALMQFLVDNLEEKSKAYREPALAFLFLMNNIHYIAQKSKQEPILRALVGDDWVRRNSGKVRQCHNGYRRAAWTKVLSCLRDQGMHVGGNVANVSRPVLKERFKSFNAAFEESMKLQSGWVISDPQLCTELRISIGEMILPAYRSFLGRFKSHIELDKHPERYIKFTPEQVETSLNDLFEGSATASSLTRKKSFQPS